MSSRRACILMRNQIKIKTICTISEGRQASAVMPLETAQRQHNNWIPMKAIELIAKKLDMAEIRVLEVATFAMFNLNQSANIFFRHVQRHLVGCAGRMK